jgi:hypothetical protein
MAKTATRKFAVILGLLLFAPHQISNAKSGPPTTIATPADVIACNGPITPGSPTIFGPAIPAPPSFDDACFGFSFTATVGTTLNFSNPTRSSSRTKQDKSAYHREAEQFTQAGRLVTRRRRIFANPVRVVLPVAEQRPERIRPLCRIADSKVRVVRRSWKRRWSVSLQREVRTERNMNIHQFQDANVGSEETSIALQHAADKSFRSPRDVIKPIERHSPIEPYRPSRYAVRRLSKPE